MKRARLTSTKPGRPIWQPFLLDGAPNVLLREETRGRAGVYAIRIRGGEILYVGESHTPSGDELRLWKTLLRHSQGCSSRKFEKLGEYMHCGGRELVDVAIWLCGASRAPALEVAVIAALSPVHNERGVEELEPAPF
jgi:hypothetical protein